MEKQYVLKIVEKPVIQRVTVTDNAMIEHLRGELAQAVEARQQAEARVSGLQGQVETSHRASQALMEEKQQYQRQVAALNARI